MSTKPDTATKRRGGPVTSGSKSLDVRICSTCHVNENVAYGPSLKFRRYENASASTTRRGRSDRQRYRFRHGQPQRHDCWMYDHSGCYRLAGKARQLGTHRPSDLQPIEHIPEVANRNRDDREQQIRCRSSRWWQNGHHSSARSHKIRIHSVNASMPLGRVPTRRPTISGRLRTSREQKRSRSSSEPSGKISGAVLESSTFVAVLVPLQPYRSSPRSQPQSQQSPCKFQIAARHFTTT